MSENHDCHPDGRASLSRKVLSVSIALLLAEAVFALDGAEADEGTGTSRRTMVLLGRAVVGALG